MVSEQNDEPPSCGASTVFLGRDSLGRWIVREQNDIFGGMFVNRTAALRYALFENGNHPEAIVVAAGPIELNSPGFPPMLAAAAPMPA